MKNVSLACHSILGDEWLEESVEGLFRQGEGRLNLDLTRVEWVELGALIALTSVIIKRISGYPQIDVQISVPSESDAKNNSYTSRAFQFLIKSQFIVALRDAHNHIHVKENIQLSSYDSHTYEMADVLEKEPPQRTEKDTGIWLWLNIIDGPIDVVKIQADKLRTRFEGEVSSKLNRDVVILDYTIYKKPAIRMRMDTLPAELLSLPDIYLEYILQTDPSGDIFILPISYFSCSEHAEFIGKRGEETSDEPKFSFNAPTFIDNELNFSAQNIDEPIREQVLSSIRFWLTELLYNIVDHGGNDGIYCCRRGDALLRSKLTARKVLSQCYKFRENFFETAVAQSFIDVYVSDTGSGFRGLENAYTSNKKRKRIVPLGVLHRYALYPDSTSKAYMEDAELPPRMTGLGVIAQDVRAKSGLIYIKDRDSLTSFTAKSLAHLSAPEAQLKSENFSDFEVTMISALMSLPNERWIRQKGLSKLDLSLDNDGQSILYVDEPTLLAPSQKYDDQSCLILSSKILKQRIIQKETFATALKKVPAGTLCLMDLSTYPNFLKDHADRLIRNIIHLRASGVFVLVYCTDVSVMSLLELSWETRKAYLYDYIKREDKQAPKRLFIPVITSDFDLYIFGDLDVNEQNELTALLAGVKSSITEAISDELGLLSNYRLPVRLIERSINRMRGHFFLKMLARSHHVKAKIMDTHGAVLDQYYEVRPYLSVRENRHHYLPDIRRYIRKYQPSVIIADSTELKLLVQEAITLFPHHEIQIGRFHEENMQFDQDSDYTNKPCMLLLAAAYSGGVLNAVSDIAERFSLDIRSVVCLLDMTGQSSSSIVKDISGQEFRAFDRLSVGEPPIRSLVLDGCDYFATVDGRLVSNIFMDEKSDDLFKSEKTNPFFLDEIQKESMAIAPETIITVGHSEVQGHHYDVLLDVRKALSMMTPSAHRMVYLAQTALRKSKATLCFYPEESELSNVLDSVEYVAGNKALEKIEVSKVGSMLVCSRKSSFDVACGKDVLFLDEGVYSANTLLTFVETIANYQPASITVVVMEVRLTKDSRVRSLKSFVNRHSKDLEFNFYCVFKFDIRCWLPGDCPYCNAGVSLRNRSPLSLPKGFSINDVPIQYESSFLAWLLRQLYSDRQQALSAIQFCNKIGDTYPQIRFNACICLLIHHEQASRMNLRENILAIFRSSLATPKTERIGYILHVLNNASITSKYKYIQQAFEVTQNKIGDNAIYREFIRIVRKRPSLKKVIQERLSVRSVAKDKAGYWKKVINANQNCTHSEALRGILTLTKMCRPNHKKLADRLLEKKPEDIVLDLDVSRLKEYFSFLNTTEQNYADQKVIENFRSPMFLATVLGDPQWRQEFLKHKVTNASELIPELIAVACDESSKKHYNFEQFPGCSGSETIQLALGISERYSLKSYIKDNCAQHGPADLEVGVNDDEYLVVLKLGIHENIDLKTANLRAKELLPLTLVDSSIEYYTEVNKDNERDELYSRIRIKIVGHTNLVQC